jgi:large repetitive protein
VFTAENPIVLVTSSFRIVKKLVDPSGVVDPSGTFTGTYSCVNAVEPPIAGDWSSTPATNDTFVVDDVFLDMTCTVTENPPGTTGLPDASWTWASPGISAPVRVVDGGTATVTVTNTVQRLWAGLEIAKTVVDPDDGALPGARFGACGSARRAARSTPHASSSAPTRP